MALELSRAVLATTETEGAEQSVQGGTYVAVCTGASSSNKVILENKLGSTWVATDVEFDDPGSLVFLAAPGIPIRFKCTTAGPAVTIAYVPNRSGAGV